MPPELKPLPLDQANKLIFVREFDRALDVLAAICKEQSWHVEAVFRLVELAVRVGQEQVAHEVVDAASADMSVAERRALMLGRCLLEIRLLERAEASEEEPSLVNPSLQETFDSETGRRLSRTLRGTSGDVVGLGAQRELLDNTSSLLGRSFLGSPGLESLRRGYMIGKSVRVARSPLVADDLSPFDPNERELAEFDRSSKELARDSDDGQGGSELSADQSKPEAARLIAALDMLLVDCPDDYAVWYVHGCACELLGQLSTALESWKRAYTFKPDSLAVLSTLSELQQLGAIGSGTETDYGRAFEALDRYAVHGTYSTHLELYNEFLGKGDARLAIASLRVLADWLQRQKGAVPPEIEIFCLLGAMKAYRMEGNSGAAESARREAENLAVSFKKSTSDFEALTFVAARSEDFELPSLARLCYFSILTSKEASRDVVLRVAAHCVSHYPSRALAECLRTAYYNFSGDAEIRFCQLLCELYMAAVPVKSYLDRKSRIRDLLSRDEISDGLALLQEAVAETAEDAEVQYYLAEIYARLGSEPLAARHYASMYALDPLNAESAVRYMQFLLKSKRYDEAEACARSLLDSGILSRELEGEVHWAMSAAAFAKEQVEYSRMAIGRALECNAWNMTFIALALRLVSPALVSESVPASRAQETETLLRQFEDSVLGGESGFPEDLLDRWLDHAALQTQLGFVAFGFLMVCAAFRWHPRHPKTMFQMAATGSAYDTRLAAQRIMMLLGQQGAAQPRGKGGAGAAPAPVPGLGHLSLCIANVYAAAGEWSLVSEWVDISNKSGPEEGSRRARLMMLEAEVLLFSGVNLGRCRSLLEAAIDSLDKSYISHDEALVLLGYVLVLQGELKTGLDRIEQALGASPSINSLYFYIKALERNGSRSSAEQALLKAFALTPATPLEARLLNELHLTVGSRRSGAIVNLVC